jgi:hypothetical protein
MKSATDDLPLVGPTSRTLGVRAQIDIPVDSDGMVQPGVGGMSVSPHAPELLPRHRRPPEFGGTGKDPVWVLDTGTLDHRLICRAGPDNPSSHAFIEPSFRMSLDSYEQALAETRGSWRRLRATMKEEPLPYMVKPPCKVTQEIESMPINMQIEEQFSEALRSDQPTLRLRDVIIDLLAHGQTRDVIATELENYRNHLQDQGRSDDEDAVLDAMDFLQGWCSPQMKI